MKLRKLTALGLAVLMTVATVACGKTETQTSEKESTPAKESTVVSESKASESAPAASEEAKKDWSDTTLRVAWWGGDARNNQTTQMIDDFVAKYYPGLNVEVEYAGFGDYFTKLTTQASAKTTADVFMMNDTRLAEFAAGGTMADLKPFIEKGIIDVSNISEAALGAGELDGALYAVNTGSNSLAMFYDPAAVEAVGMEMPLEPTWKDVLDLTDAIYAKTGQQLCITFYTGSNQILDAWLMSKGKGMFADDMKSVGFDVEDLVEYCELAIDTYAKESVFNATYTEMEHFAELSDENNMWAMINGEWSNVCGSFEAASGKTVKLATSPIADDATAHGAYLHPCMLWAVSANSAPELQEIGAAFINYFANETFPYDVAGLDRGVPINNEVAAYLAEKAAPVDAHGIEFINTLVEEEIARPNIKYPNGYNEAHRAISELTEAVSYGTQGKDGLKEAAEAAIQKANEILAAAN